MAAPPPSAEAKITPPPVTTNGDNKQSAASVAAAAAVAGAEPVRKKLFTLFFILEPTRVLLGMKKRGFGAGKLNGFGGKVESGESISLAAIRELKEEAGITPVCARQQAVVYFELEGSPVIFEVHLFVANEFTGVVTESEEMKPVWYDRQKVPFELMWKDDAEWFPHLFAARFFRGFFLFRGMCKPDVATVHQTFG